MTTRQTGDNSFFLWYMCKTARNAQCMKPVQVCTGFIRCMFPAFVTQTIFTHLSRMDIPNLINWTNLFPILALVGGIFHLIGILMENSDSRQSGHLSDAAFCGV